MTRRDIFSEHALIRIKERTKLSGHAIAQLLDGHYVVVMGAKPGLHRNHILFYSEPDDDYFIIIQDALDGTCVTVLPLDYHGNLAWNATPSQKHNARLKYLEYKTLQNSINTESIRLGSITVLVNAHYIDTNELQKSKLLGKLKLGAHSELHQVDLAYLREAINLTHLAAKKNICLASIFSISIRTKKHDSIIFFDRDAIDQMIRH